MNIDFPKQYIKIKPITEPTTKQQYPIFFLPEQYNGSINIEMILKFFLLDTIHSFYFKEQIKDIDFITYLSGENNNKAEKELKRTLLKIGIKSNPTLRNKKDLSLSFYIQNFFSELYNKGFISEDNSLVLRSNKKQGPIDSSTTISKTKKKKCYTLKYFVSAKNHVLDTITEHPETIFGDVAIAIHPQYKKAKQLKDQEAIIPIINKKIPIIIDDRINFTTSGGVYRITPGHDQLSFEIAKDHNLPTNTYAINQDGVFTDNAGVFSHKNVDDFFTNIVQNLSDIGNLIHTETIEVKDFYEKNDNEKLNLRKREGLFCKIPEDSHTRTTRDNKLNELNIDVEQLRKSYRLASCYDNAGIPIPIYKKDNNLTLTDSKRLYTNLNKTGNPHMFVFATFLLQLIYTKSIPNPFSIENIIDALFEHGKNNIENFFVELETQFSQKDINTQQILKSINNILEGGNNDLEISNILENLDSSPFISKQGVDSFLFDFEKIDSNLKGATHYGQEISDSIINIAIILKKRKGIDINNPGLFCEINHSIEQCIKGNILLESLLNQELVTNFEAIPPIKLENKIKNQLLKNDFIKNSHPDCIRVSLLSLINNQNKLSEQSFTKRDKSLANFWNACRYIYQNTNHFHLDIGQAQEKIESNIDILRPIDLWMIFKINKLIEEQQKIKSPKHIGDFINNLFDFIEKDLSSKYIETNKIEHTIESDLILYYISVVCIILLKNYAPIITNKLLQIFKINKYDLQPIGGIKKNYSISLLMDIIEKLSNNKQKICLKKHEQVDIFVRSNPDFLNFIKNHEIVLKKAINTRNIAYLMHHEQIPDGYEKEDIIDIIVGIKSIEKNTPTGVVSLEKQLLEKENHLQYLKNLVQHMSMSNTDPSLIQTKKNEISQLKEDIEIISFEINKCKVKD